MPLAAFPLAAVLSWLLVPVVVRVATALGFLDQPAERKLHTSVTPLLGGVSVFVAAMIVWAIGMRLLPHAAADWEAYYLLTGAAVALAVGVWDDRFGMLPSVKMLGQAAAGTLLLAAGVTPELGLPVGIEAALALVALIALMNAVNFLDNMNGMVGGIAAITLAAFAWTSIDRGALGIATAQLALAGACAGFLPHNFPRARIFLGDAGSLFLGYSLGASALLALRATPPGWGQAGPLLMLAYPAFDMLFVIVTRMRDGRPVWLGGKDHSNHRLATLLRCPIRTVLLIWCSTAVLCAGGIVILRDPQPLKVLLLSGLWTTMLVWSGLRLSSVPLAPRA